MSVFQLFRTYGANVMGISGCCNGNKERTIIIMFCTYGTVTSIENNVLSLKFDVCNILLVTVKII